MPQATFRFYAELNDFLPLHHRQRPVGYPLNGPVAVKHPIEALGVPHTEVALILANGRPAPFGYLLQDGDYLSVYPAFSSLETEELLPLRPQLPSPPQFLLDNHLGQLATYLHLLGFDANYRNDYDDLELARMAYETQRVLLTRDRRLLMRKVIVHGYCLRSKEPRQQLLAVMRRYRLGEHIAPWQRCLRCNGRLEPVAKETILDRLEPKTRLYYDEFRICPECQRIYWKGSHYEPMERFIAGVLEELLSSLPDTPFSEN